MSEKSYVSVSLIIGHLSKYYDLSSYAILSLFISSCRRQIIHSIDILLIHTSLFYIKNINLIIKLIRQKEII